MTGWDIAARGEEGVIWVKARGRKIEKWTREELRWREEEGKEGRRKVNVQDATHEQEVEDIVSAIELISQERFRVE